MQPTLYLTDSARAQNERRAHHDVFATTPLPYRSQCAGLLLLPKWCRILPEISGVHFNVLCLAKGALRFFEISPRIPSINRVYPRPNSNDSRPLEQEYAVPIPADHLEYFEVRKKQYSLSSETSLYSAGNESDRRTFLDSLFSFMQEQAWHTLRCSLKPRLMGV
ncbi:hypothetical protein QTP88_008135 [Uroleucon formosanum]